MVLSAYLLHIRAGAPADQRLRGPGNIRRRCRALLRAERATSSGPASAAERSAPLLLLLSWLLLLPGSIAHARAHHRAATHRTRSLRRAVTTQTTAVNYN